MVIQSQPDLLLVAQAENAEHALSQFRCIRPDVTIMDQRLPGAKCTDALIAIRKESPRAIVMMVTTSKQDMDVRRALNAGAAAYVLKNTPKAEMLRVIRWVSQGRRHIPSEVASTIAEHLGQEELSPREISVQRLIRDGHRNKQIAQRLGISETTVNFISGTSSKSSRQSISAITSASRRRAVRPRSEFSDLSGPSRRCGT